MEKNKFRPDGEIFADLRAKSEEVESSFSKAEKKAAEVMNPVNEFLSDESEIVSEMEIDSRYNMGDMTYNQMLEENNGVDPVTGILAFPLSEEDDLPVSEAQKQIVQIRINNLRRDATFLQQKITDLLLHIDSLRECK